MFRFGRNARYNDIYRRSRDSARDFVTSSNRNGRVVTASGFGGSGGGFGGGGSGGSSGGSDPFSGGSSSATTSDSLGGGQGFNNDRYNPVFDHLEEGTVLEDWIARDGAGLDLMYRRMYLRDPTLGPGIDLIRSLPWSSYTLEGIDDPAIMQIYQDSVDAMHPELLMPDLTGDYLVLGRSPSSLIFDSRRGIFSGVVPHNPDFVRVTPLPVYGFDPICDFKLSPGFKKFLTSSDPRAADARRALPPAFVEAASKDSGFLPLDPVSTVYLARKLGPTDQIGTSILTRAVYFWAIEKALLNAQMTSTRRRSRSLAHIVAGIDGQWNPTPEEMDALAGLVIQANEDPVGGVIATRTGVSINEPLGGGADFYKWSDELELFAKYKMQSIGISDALINGDAPYANAEQARSVFVENLSNLRSRITHGFFTQKVFPTIAKIHKFVKRTKAELDHRIRTSSAYNEQYERYLANTRSRMPIYAQNQRLTLNNTVPGSGLWMPKFAWAKTLKPTQDEAMFGFLERLKQNEYPVTLSQWAQAAGLNAEPDAMQAEIEKDQTLRKSLQELEAGAGGEATDQDMQDIDKLLDEAPEAPSDQPEGEKEPVKQSVYAKAKRIMSGKVRGIREIPIWNGGTCGGLTQREAIRTLGQIIREYDRTILKRPDDLRQLLNQKLGERKARVMSYCLNRLGIARLPIDHATAQVIVGAARDRMNRHTNFTTDSAMLDMRRYETELQCVVSYLKVKGPRKSKVAEVLQTSATPITASTMAGYAPPSD